MWWNLENVRPHLDVLLSDNQHLVLSSVAHLSPTMSLEKSMQIQKRHVRKEAYLRERTIGP